jgi:AraC-like DNA-binding protein
MSAMTDSVGSQGCVSEVGRLLGSPVFRNAAVVPSAHDSSAAPPVMPVWLTMSAPRAEWVRAITHAFVTLVDVLSRSTTADPDVEPLDQTPEPINDVERLIFRCYVSELLLGALYLGVPLFRREDMESILTAWPMIQQDLAPVSVLRRALGRGVRSGLVTDARLAEQVRNLLDCRYAEKIVARNIANELKVSESRMNRCFRRAYGTTIHQHLMRVRVRHGLDLVSKGVKIEAAGLAVGFRSKKDFYRAVQQLVGCTPAQFRSRLVRR